MADPNSKKRDRSNGNFKKACLNLMRRCDDVSEKYDADIYLLVRRKGVPWEYCSLLDPQWPLPRKELSRSYPLPIRRTPAFFPERRTHRKESSSPALTTSSSDRGVSGGTVLSDCSQDSPSPSKRTLLTLDEGMNGLVQDDQFEGENQVADDGFGPEDPALTLDGDYAGSC
ncbi:hypothetical protein EV126DRAFT_424245 [Verticillium dahliae]|nr:hypothetical protein EV126DRAFT_424245 [Verticillium dahliae]